MRTLCDLYLEFHEFHAARVPDRLKSLSAPGRFAWQKLARKIAARMREEETLFLVAEIDGSVVGLAELYLREDDKENPAVVGHRYAHLQSLLVTEPLQRRGVGRALLAAAEAWAADNGAEEVRLETWEYAGGPLGFYERAGYKTLKRELVRRLGDGPECAGLEKRVDHHS